MEIYVSEQLRLFINALLLGGILGLTYDVFRIIRVAVKHGNALIFAEDALYWMFCAGVTFVYLLSQNSGQVRFYVILGEFLGAVIYYFTLGKLILSLARTIIKIVKAIIKFIYSITLRPFVLLFLWLYRLLSRRLDKHKAKLKARMSAASLAIKKRRMMLFGLLGVKKKRKKRIMSR